MFGLEIGLSELNENSEFVAVSHSGALSLFNDMLQRKYVDHFFLLREPFFRIACLCPQTFWLNANPPPPLFQKAHHILVIA